jgi:hypothetical protein
MVVRVSRTEFELDNGAIYPHPVPLERVPSVEEFRNLKSPLRGMAWDHRGNPNFLGDERAKKYCALAISLRRLAQEISK